MVCWMDRILGWGGVGESDSSFSLFRRGDVGADIAYKVDLARGYTGIGWTGEDLLVDVFLDFNIGVIRGS